MACVLSGFCGVYIELLLKSRPGQLSLSLSLCPSVASSLALPPPPSLPPSITVAPNKPPPPSLPRSLFVSLGRVAAVRYLRPHSRGGGPAKRLVL